jgi:hypothetical protein
MEEIEQLLAKLKQDQEAIYNNFEVKVRRAYEGKQKQYKDQKFTELKTIIESVFIIPELFIKTNKHYNVAARTSFDHILNQQEGFSYEDIAKETNRDRATIRHSIENYLSFYNSTDYKEKYETIISLYAKNKSNTTN